MNLWVAGCWRLSRTCRIVLGAWRGALSEAGRTIAFVLPYAHKTGFRRLRRGTSVLSNCAWVEHGSRTGPTDIRQYTIAQPRPACCT